MSFPKYKRNWIGIRKPDGWEDLGVINSIIKNPEYKTESIIVHKICRRRAHVGREVDKLFWFCPLCLVMIEY